MEEYSYTLHGTSPIQSPLSSLAASEDTSAPNYMNNYCLYKKDEIVPVASSTTSSATHGSGSGVFSQQSSSSSFSTNSGSGRFSSVAPPSPSTSSNSGSGRFNFSSSTTTSSMDNLASGTEALSLSPSKNANDESLEHVKLEIEYTDLSPKDERGVRKYILHKANRNLVYNHGQIGILPTFVSFSKISGTTMCYYAQFEVKDVPTEILPGSVELERKSEPITIGNSFIPAEELNKPKFTLKAQEYIICFICEVQTDEGFALFRADLDIFCEKIKRMVYDVKVNNKSADLLKDHMSSWYPYNIEYVNRCIDLLKDKLAIILHASLIGKHVVVVKRSGQNAFVEDLSRFLKAAALTSTTTAEGKHVSKLQPSIAVIDESAMSSMPKGNQLVISIDAQYNLNVNSNETNIFCREWAKELRATTKDSLILRNVMEHQKFKVIQELNHLRRLCDQAKLNNYALYKAYRILKQNSNSDVLLSLLIQEYTASNDASGTEVLEVIQKSLSGDK
eukprot:TRINITY_DN10915_c0_g1_i1.p1 TRINITY_DN10915_c0_g1~~TRINITY_DN10915_c0_g1_i1.p1  ORF type:complete len:505 (+),score=144.90 TRINITY_DN10915_c0_g1_i1:85-1599(+)